MEWGTIINTEKMDSSYDGSEQELENNYTDEKKPIDRNSILEKYGIKEANEEDVEELLETRDSNILNNKDIERMERIVAKKIYNAIISIQTVKKASVEVLIENSDELYGTANIIVECEPKSFLDKLFRNSSKKEDVYIETIEVTQTEISEIFEGYPEVVENFKINIESF